MNQFPVEIYEPEATVLVESADKSLMGYVVSGLVKGVLVPQSQASVRETTVLAGESDWFGFEIFVKGPNIIRYVAVNEARVRLIPRQWLIDEANSEIREALLSQVSTQWAIRTSFIADKSLTVEVRILRWLIIIRQKTKQLEINLKQADLADLAGVTRASVTEPLQQLQLKGLIELHRGHFILPELQTLVDAFQAKISR